MKANSRQQQPVTMSTMPLRGADYRIVAIASMEQIVGAGLSTVVGIMLPVMQLVEHPQLPSFLQGLIGAMGLIGIGVGSFVIGRLTDRQGYLRWFRLCPLLITIGALICWLLPSVTTLIIGLFIIGFGVGGGYDLDSDYISELMPSKWRKIMLGVAKTSCSIGFIGVAGLCYYILRQHPDPAIWNRLILIIGAMGVITFLSRIKWYESPLWLRDHGQEAAAEKAVKQFLGDDVTLAPAPESTPSPTSADKPEPQSMWRGKNLLRVIFSGIPWACEGMGVYGFGVFLPILLIALGIESDSVHGIKSVTDSVGVTTIVNFFMLPGFLAGLLIMQRVNHVKMLVGGFIGSALSLGLILIGYLLKWPVWVIITGFIGFEFMLNCGPHLITFVIPASVFPIEERSTGTGIASMLGKVGAILGVIVMPIMLDLGGMQLVMIVSIAVMLAGALIGLVFGRLLKLV